VDCRFEKTSASASAKIACGNELFITPLQAWTSPDHPRLLAGRLPCCPTQSPGGFRIDKRQPQGMSNSHTKV
jgi:hypothetical protein